MSQYRKWLHNKCTGDKCTGDKCTGDKCNGDECTGDECTSDKCTGDKCTDGEQIEIIVTGYAVNVDQIRLFLEKEFSDLDYQFDLTSDYEQIRSKCSLLNRYLASSNDKCTGTPGWGCTEPIFYCEYDITIESLFPKLSRLLRLIKSNKYPDIALWCFNHNSHQMTIYENPRQIQGLTVTSPFIDNGLAIGTGCWLLSLPVCQSFDCHAENKIHCPSYGYGHDDLHFNEWIQRHNLKAVVIKEWWCQHQAVNIPQFTNWKREVLTRPQPLTKTEYEQFWTDLTNQLLNPIVQDCAPSM